MSSTPPAQQLAAGARDSSSQAVLDQHQQLLFLMQQMQQAQSAALPLTPSHPQQQHVQKPPKQKAQTPQTKKQKYHIIRKAINNCCCGGAKEAVNFFNTFSKSQFLQLYNDSSNSQGLIGEFNKVYSKLGTSEYAKLSTRGHQSVLDMKLILLQKSSSFKQAQLELTKLQSSKQAIAKAPPNTPIYILTIETFNQQELNQEEEYKAFAIVNAVFPNCKFTKKFGFIFVWSLLVNNPQAIGTLESKQAELSKYTNTQFQIRTHRAGIETVIQICTNAERNSVILQHQIAQVICNYYYLYNNGRAAITTATIVEVVMSRFKNCTIDLQKFRDMANHLGIDEVVYIYQFPGATSPTDQILPSRITINTTTEPSSSASKREREPSNEATDSTEPLEKRQRLLGPKIEPTELASPASSSTYTTTSPVAVAVQTESNLNSSPNVVPSASTPAVLSAWPENEIHEQNFEAFQDDICQLAHDCSTLIAESTIVPAFSDVAFVLGSRTFHTVRVLLYLRSSYFAKLFAQSSTRSIDIATQPEISWVAEYPSVFVAALQYLLSGQITVQPLNGSLSNWLILASFANCITHERLKQVAVKCFNQEVNRIHQETNVLTILQARESLDNLPALFRNSHSELIQGSKESLQRHLLQQVPNLLSADKEMFHSLPKQILEMLLRQNTSLLPETQMLNKLVEWAKAQVLKKMPPGTSTDVSPEKIRQELEGLLPLIQFEYFAVEEIVDLESIGVLRQADILELVKATINVAKGSGYTVLGVSFSEPRKKREVVSSPQPVPSQSTTNINEEKTVSTAQDHPVKTHSQETTNNEESSTDKQENTGSSPRGRRVRRHTSRSSSTQSTETQDCVPAVTSTPAPTPASVEKPMEKETRAFSSPNKYQQSYTIKLGDLIRNNGMLTLPAFECGQYDWCLRVQTNESKHLGILLYNKQLVEHTITKVPVKVHISFSLVKHSTPNSSLVRVVDKEWGTSFAWGYTNFISVDDLVQEKNGYIQKHEFTVELSMKITDRPKSPII